MRDLTTADPYSGDSSLTYYDYNGYRTNTSRTSPTGPHDVIVTNSSFGWQSGWLGNFYLQRPVP